MFALRWLLLAHLSLVVVMTVTPKEWYGLIGQRNFDTQSLVFFYDGEHVDLRVGCTRKEMLINCTHGKNARLTRTKDASQLSSAVWLTKCWPIIRSPPPRRPTLPYCIIGWFSLMTDWTTAFWTSKRVAKQAKTLLCIARGKISQRLGVASL